MSRSTHEVKKFKFLDKTYKFKTPLKIVIDNFFCHDLKTIKGELSIPSITDGYTGEEIKNPDKEIKNYLNYVFENYLSKKDEELDTSDNAYKNKWLGLIDFDKTK